MNLHNLYLAFLRIYTNLVVVHSLMLDLREQTTPIYNASSIIYLSLFKLVNSELLSSTHCAEMNFFSATTWASSV